jgi:peptidoglycan-associated lipoprotein
MKAIKFANLLAFAIAITLGTAGCKTHNPGPVIKFDDQGRPIPGSGERTPGAGEKIGEDHGVETKPGEGIAFGKTDYSTWGQDREALKADTIRFDYDSAVVKPGDHSKVVAVADYLKANSTIAVRVEGHCDERGTDEYNRALGERRAIAIREELVKSGADAGRVDTVSFGRDRPVDTGHSEASHRKNRRGEFVVLTPPR